MALVRLKSLSTLNNNNLEAKNFDLYRLLCSQELLTIAYNSIKSKPGNMTPGTDGKTLDGLSEEVLDKLMSDLRDQSFQFSPVLRVYIPKGNSGKLRPLGIPPPREKIVHKGMLMILEAIYDPTFSEHSHGFRSGRSCHTALREFRTTWRSTAWAIEGDIKGCYDNVDHTTLINIIRRKVADERFIRLIWKMLRAGIIEDGKYSPTTVGTPQGGIVSPLLSNIYLNELDVFIGQIQDLTCAYTGNLPRKDNPEYSKIKRKIYRLRRERDSPKDTESKKRINTQVIMLSKALRQLPSTDPNDPKFIRIKYVRYADDWVVGITGSMDFTKFILSLIDEFIKNVLKMELSSEKTVITKFSSGKVRFLGYFIKIGSVSTNSLNKNSTKKRTVGHNPRLFAPSQQLVRKLYENNFCTHEGRGVRKKGWIYYPDEIIVQRYNSIIRGYRNYYAPADNFSTTMSRIEYILLFSCAHTLASKHRTRVSTQIRRLKRELKLSISKTYTNNLWDFRPNQEKISIDRIYSFYVKRTKLLSSDKCIICKSTDRLESHHVRALRKDGVNLHDKYFIGVMQRMNRKQITVCRNCHQKIHNGLYDGISLRTLPGT